MAAPHRSTIENLRRIGLSYRHVAQCAKIIHDVDLTYSSVQRHETGGHFSKDTKIASTADLNDPAQTDWDNLTVGEIIKTRMKKYWEAYKDVIPTDSEMRAWIKVWSEIQSVEGERDRTNALRELFKPKQLAIAEVIEGEVIVR